MGKYTKRWNQKKPQAPKRPTPPFANFVSILHDNQLTDAKGKELFRAASVTWKTLTDMEKALYRDHDGIDTYKQRVAQHREVISAMKRPASAFGLYVRHYWRTQKPAYNGQRENFGIIQKQIAADWGEINEEEKKVYTAASNLLKTMFEKEQHAVLEEESELNLKWQEEGLMNLEAALFKKLVDKQINKDDEEHNVKEKDRHEENIDDDDMDTDDEYEEQFDYGMEED